MERVGHRPHRPGPAGAVLDGDAVGRTVGAGGHAAVRQAVWYRKPKPTFADAVAVVRQQVWTLTHFPMPPTTAGMVEIPRTLLARLTDTLCYAA
jgi:hypothetical protein